MVPFADMVLEDWFVTLGKAHPFVQSFGDSPNMPVDNNLEPDTGLDHNASRLADHRTAKIVRKYSNIKR